MKVSGWRKEKIDSGKEENPLQIYSKLSFEFVTGPDLVVKTK